MSNDKPKAKIIELDVVKKGIFRKHVPPGSNRSAEAFKEIASRGDYNESTHDSLSLYRKISDFKTLEGKDYKLDELLLKPIMNEISIKLIKRTADRVWDDFAFRQAEPVSVFKEKRPGKWYGPNGWIIQEKKEEVFSEGGFVATKHSYLWSSAAGEELGQSHTLAYFQDYFDCEFHSYLERTGRNGRTEMDVKFGPDHFPRGTKFKVFDHVERNVPKVLTVNHLRLMGARNWAIVAEEMKHPTAEETEKVGRGNLFPYQYNLCHVEKVISRGKGSMVVFDEPDFLLEMRDLSTFLLVNREDNEDICKKSGLPLPVLHKNEHAFLSVDVVLMEVLKEIGADVLNHGKWINDDGFARMAQKNGFLRMDRLYGDIEQSWTFFFILNIRKMKKWLKKNHRKVYHTLDYSQKGEDEEAERNHRALSRLSY